MRTEHHHSRFRLLWTQEQVLIRCSLGFRCGRFGFGGLLTHLDAMMCQLIVGLLCALVRVVLCLRMTSIDVPEYQVADESVALKCNFDMEGDELYSVKWYKDGSEFYRFVPKDRPASQVYALPGVRVDLNQSDRNKVMLDLISLESSGLYKCEVSAEAPSFNTVHDEGGMTVLALPHDGPQISGGRPKYQVGEMVMVNCSSARSKPAALLSWSVNGDSAPKNYVREFAAVYDEDGLETSILGLEFRVEEQHFKEGEMRLRCTASISPVYYRVNEESITGGNLQQAAVLESRNPLIQVRLSAANGGERTILTHVLYFVDMSIFALLWVLQ